MKTYNRRRPQKVPEEGERFRGDATQSSSQAFDAFLDNPEDPYYLPSDSDAPEAPPKVVARQCTKQASSAQAVPKQQRATRPPSATLRQNRAVISAPFAEKKPRKATGDSANAVTENSTGEIASTTTSSRAEQEGRKRKEPATCSPAISEALDDVVASSSGAAAKSSRQSDRPEPAPARKPTRSSSRTRLPAPKSFPQRPSRLAKASKPKASDQTLQPPASATAAELEPPTASPQKQVQQKTAAAAAKLAEASTPSNGLRTPLLMRNALSAGLARVLSGPVFSTPAPAVTVMEAWESGEQMEVQDSMLYALDGLCSTSSTATHRESAASLAEVCATRRGRLALKPDGVFAQAAAAASVILSRQWDPELGLAFAAMLLCFSRDAANQGVLACKEALQLLCVLLQSAQRKGRGELDQSEASSSRHRVLRLLQEGSQAKGVPPAASTSPASVAILAIVGATDPQAMTGATEALKAGMRAHGVLASLAHFVASQRSTSNAERQTWLLHQFLVALENCSFACPENEAYLVGLRIPSDSSHSVGFATALVNLVDAISGGGVPRSSSAEGECLHCALSVIMNVTHHNAAGCNQVLDAGGLGVTARLLSASMAEGSGRDDRRQLLEQVDIVSVALGLLINVAEACPSGMAPLIEAQLPHGRRFLPLLCRLMEGVRQEAAAEGSPGPQRSGSSRGEITVEQLARHEEDGRAAIVEVYAALLIGFLVSPAPQLRAEATAALPGGSLEPVRAGVQRCLKFYLDAGAITERTEQSLRNLLSSLNEG